MSPHTCTQPQAAVSTDGPKHQLGLWHSPVPPHRDRSVNWLHIGLLHQDFLDLHHNHQQVLECWGEGRPVCVAPLLLIVLTYSHSDFSSSSASDSQRLTFSIHLSRSTPIFSAQGVRLRAQSLKRSRNWRGAGAERQGQVRQVLVRRWMRAARLENLFLAQAAAPRADCCRDYQQLRTPHIFTYIHTNHMWEIRKGVLVPAYEMTQGSRHVHILQCIAEYRP